MIVFLASVLFALTAVAGELKYCIQVAADRDLNRIKNYYERVKELPQARIERREDLYLLRVGAEERRRDLRIMHRKVRNLFPDAYIKKCEIDDKYVVYPEPKGKETEGIKEDTTALGVTPDVKEEKVEKEKSAVQKVEEVKRVKVAEGIKPDIEELKARIDSLKEDLEEIKEILREKKDKTPAVIRGEDPAYFEKFLYSVGIFIGGLFLFTWILLILLYRKVGSTNFENTNLLNDMFKLIKVLNLLSKGKIVKMEGGKPIVYNPKEDRWNEVE